MKLDRDDYFSSDNPMLELLQNQNNIMLTELLARGGGGNAPSGGDAALIELIKGMQSQTNTMLQALTKPDTP